jgi:hypothetical protein
MDSRLYLGYRERFVDDCVVSLPMCGSAGRRIGGKGEEATVLVSQRPTLPKAVQALLESGDDSDEIAQATGCTVWDGALFLGRAIASLPPAALRHTSITTALDPGWRPRGLEIGAGTGALGLSIAACGAVSSMVSTDMPAVLPLTAANIKKNQDVLSKAGAVVAAAPLLWRTNSREVVTQLESIQARVPAEHFPLELVVGSDIVYRDDTADVGTGEETPVPGGSQADKVLGTLAALLPAGSTTVALLALGDHADGKVAAFVQRARTEHGLRISHLGNDDAAFGSAAVSRRHKATIAQIASEARAVHPTIVMLRAEAPPLSRDDKVTAAALTRAKYTDHSIH